MAAAIPPRKAAQPTAFWLELLALPMYDQAMITHITTRRTLVTLRSGAVATPAVTPDTPSTPAATVTLPATTLMTWP
ncbi:hypothetical protein ABZ815_12040 [Nonomuraea sp. NPDC047529]|uniref:hypothetical protein n=1 Tax=Nonomuraea sp. NPDC047529 TaxID=3155623 RepID=UPI0033DFA130